MSKAQQLLEVSPAKAARDAARQAAFLAKKHAEFGHQDNHHQHNQVQQPSVPAMTPQRLHHDHPAAPVVYSNKPSLGGHTWRQEKIEADEPVAEEPKYVPTEQERMSDVERIKAQLKAGTYQFGHKTEPWKRGVGAGINSRLREGKIITMTKAQYIMEVSDKKKARDAERMATYNARKNANAAAFQADKERHTTAVPHKIPVHPGTLKEAPLAGYTYNPHTGGYTKESELHRPATKAPHRHDGGKMDMFKAAELYRSQQHEPLKFRDMSPKEGHLLPWQDPRNQGKDLETMKDQSVRGLPNWRDMKSGGGLDPFVGGNATPRTVQDFQAPKKPMIDHETGKEIDPKEWSNRKLFGSRWAGRGKNENTNTSPRSRVIRGLVSEVLAKKN